MSGVEIAWTRAASADAKTLAACLDLLDPEERIRHDRFVFDKNKVEYLLTRGLERGVLARATGSQPKALGFRRTPLGRPELEPPPAGGLRFNLTNTVHLVAIAVAWGRDIGVDAEPLARADQVLDVAERVFTDRERSSLAALAPEVRQARAVTLWTLKEAYIKARGMGFSLPVDQFEVTEEDTLRFAPTIDDDPQRWYLATHRVGDHVVSICVEGHAEVSVAEADLGALLLG